jgi:hypothetical protein
MHVLDRALGFLRRVAAPAGQRELVIVGSIFLASRIAAFIAGVRFDADDLAGFWHFAPLHLLETRLLETVFYLHFQPPLFNLYLGLVVQVFGAWSSAAFGASFLLLGLALSLVLFVLMRRLGVEPRVALVLTCLFSLSPPALLFETYLFYELPVTALLVGSALALHAAVESGKAAAWAVLFSLFATLVLTRALFHPLVLFVLVLVSFWRLRSQRHAIVRGAVVPVLLVLAVCAKNGVLFQSFGTSTWLGMGLARMTLRSLDPATKKAWVRDGVLSPVAGVHPPSPLEAYRAVTKLPEPTGIPVLDEPLKPGGDLNLHHLAYARISKTLLADDWVVLRREPGVYARAASEAFRRFFQPASSWHPLVKNRRRIAFYDRAYNAVFHFGERGGPMVVLFFGSMLGAFLRLRTSGPFGERAVVAFMLSLMAYVLLTGTLLEPLENMRFRFAVEPYLWTLVGLFGTSLLARRHRVSP